MQKFWNQSRLKSLSLFVLGVFLLQGTLVPTGAASEFIAPDEVKNVRAETGDSLVKLSWDSSMDSDGVVMGYKIYMGKNSVQDMDDVYEETILTNSTSTSYTIRDLDNGTAYYFAVTALDDEENESDTYSVEVSATPKKEAPSEPPYVMKAEQIDRNEVSVFMSKPVRLLAGEHSFLVQRKVEGGFLDLEVLSALVDDTVVTLKLLDGMLGPENIYRVTATSTVEDLDGVPVTSGVVDSVEFGGLNMGDQVASSGDAFLNPSLPEDDVQNFDYSINNMASGDSFHNLPAVDTTAPLDASGIYVDTTNLGVSGSVDVLWTPAFDRDEDIVDQVFYVKAGTGSWDNGYSIGKEEQALTLDVKKDLNYEVKVVTVDKSGNKSLGATFAFTTTLTETGSGMWMSWGILGMIILGVSSLLRRRGSW